MLPPVMIYCAVCAPVVMVTGVIALAGTGAATTTAVRMAIIKSTVRSLRFIAATHPDVR